MDFARRILGLSRIPFFFSDSTDQISTSTKSRWHLLFKCTDRASFWFVPWELSSARDSTWDLESWGRWLGWARKRWIQRWFVWMGSFQVRIFVMEKRVDYRTDFLFLDSFSPLKDTLTLQSARMMKWVKHREHIFLNREEKIRLILRFSRTAHLHFRLLFVSRDFDFWTQDYEHCRLNRTNYSIWTS